MASEQAKPRAKVRKIFKKGETYQCGLCGGNFASLADVQANLRQCTVGFLAEGGAVEASPKRYRCSFCKRIHNSMDAARECSGNCKKDIERRSRHEASLNASTSVDQKLKALAQFAKDPSALSALKAAETQHSIAPLKSLGVYKPKKAEILAGENVKFVREKNQFRCLKCRQRYSSASDARGCWDGHGETYVSHLKAKSSDVRYTLDGKKFRCSKCERIYGSVEDAIKCHESHDAPAEKRAKKDEGFAFAPDPSPVTKSKKDESSAAFYRDGAKYVCRKCSKKYFSRDEVIACYESLHKNSESVNDLPDLEADLKEIKAPPAKLRNDAERFFRDGAKYVCRGCSKKYFSRDETLACFASHAG
ncbi:MAG: hypothetical protein H7318_02720 [Oligoflexus sp.]|nr:hypothetical protein [Oligoflexus sp.]